MPPKSPIRYGVVGLGHLAQAAVLPAFKHTENAVLTALVSGDATKLKRLGKRYKTEVNVPYEEYERCLEAVDAVYIATPNSLHDEFTIRAAESNVHVLSEKPLADTVRAAEQMVEACRSHGVKLMTAYRLHFETINLEAIEIVRGGRIGEPKFFTASFGMTVKPDNIRADEELGGGSIFDLGVYCINASRYLFAAEPKEVVGCLVNSVPDRLPEIDESTAAILRFEGEKVATFVSSFNSSDVSTYRVVGTEGDLLVEPAFDYSEPLGYVLTIDGKKTRKRGKRVDQFAPQIDYFARCVLENREPEPSGEEGLQDVRIARAILESAEIGKPIEIPPYRPAKRPSLAQQEERRPVEHGPLVNVEAGHE